MLVTGEGNIRLFLTLADSFNFIGSLKLLNSKEKFFEDLGELGDSLKKSGEAILRLSDETVINR